ETTEVPGASVIARADARPSEDELRAFCRGKIASYKIPRHVRFVADVPRTPSPHGDKVQRGKMRARARGLAAPALRPAGYRASDRAIGDGRRRRPGPRG